MRQIDRLRKIVLGLAVVTVFSACNFSLYGQAEKPSISAAANEPSEHKWSDAQLVTSTVSQAWHLSGRNDEEFFDMVQQLATISAKNRGLVLPDNKAAGERAGQYIKQMAKSDRKQLLYVIVDKAVQKVGIPIPAAATPSTTK